MNRSKIEWCDHVWNPITGCQGNCKCNAERLATRFAGDIRRNLLQTDKYTIEDEMFVLDEPFGKISYPFGFNITFHKYRLDYPTRLKTSNNIYVGSTGDIFGCWVKNKYLKQIISSCKETSRHNYLFLTKTKGNYENRELPKKSNFWYGMVFCKEMCSFLEKGYKRFAYIQQPEEIVELKYVDIDWLIIDATKETTAEAVNRILKIYSNTPIFMLKELKELMGDSFKQEYPKKLQIKKGYSKERTAVCKMCGNRNLKKEMYTICFKKPGERTTNVMYHLCSKCFRREVLR